VQRFGGARSGDRGKKKKQLRSLRAAGKKEENCRKVRVSPQKKRRSSGLMVREAKCKETRKTAAQGRPRSSKKDAEKPDQILLWKRNQVMVKKQGTIEKVNRRAMGN